MVGLFLGCKQSKTRQCSSSVICLKAWQSFVRGFAENIESNRRVSAVASRSTWFWRTTKCKPLRLNNAELLPCMLYDLQTMTGVFYSCSLQSHSGNVIPSLKIEPFGPFFTQKNKLHSNRNVRWHTRIGSVETSLSQGFQEDDSQPESMFSTINVLA